MENVNGNVPPILGTPRKIKDGVYGIKNKAIIGRPYTIVCPECHKSMQIRAESTKAHKRICKNCNTIICYIGKEEEAVPNEEDAAPTIEPEEEEEKSALTHKYKMGRENNKPDTPHAVETAMPNAKLVWGGLFRKKSYELNRTGKYYIGRDDEEIKSDIAIDDAYVSRRSVLIEVVNRDKGCSYKLTVKNATNPVLVNGQEYRLEEFVYLNYGDTILVGNTTITFKQK